MKKNTTVTKLSSKIQELTNRNQIFAQKIEAFKQNILDVQKALSSIEIINHKTYLQYKAIAKRLNFYNSEFNKVKAQYVHNKYLIYWYGLIDKDKNIEKKQQKYLKGDWYYNFVKYIEKVSDENRIFPYHHFKLVRLNHLNHCLLNKNNRLVYLKSICLRSKILAHKSVWVLQQKIKILEHTITNLKTKIDDIQLSFIERYHANVVSKLEKSKKDRDALLTAKKLKEQKILLKNDYKKKKKDLHQQVIDLNSNLTNNLKKLTAQYKTNKIDKNHYFDQKAIFIDQHKEKIAQLRYSKKAAKYDYLNYSDFDKNTYAIELSNVVKYYNNGYIATKVLDNVNLKIKRGEFVVILGPSGSGKTTLMNIISGMDNASYGKVLVANENLIDYNQAKLTKFRRINIGYVFQQYGLLPNLTVKENVQIGQNLQFNKNKHIDIDEILESIGMFAQRNKYPNELSGGQQQRVSIARSIAKNPNILFGDEPTGAVDEKMSKEIMNLFININKKYKTTIIIVTHNPTIAQLASTIIYVGNGTISKVEHIKKPKTVEEINWSGINLSKKSK